MSDLLGPLKTGITIQNTTPEPEPQVNQSESAPAGIIGTQDSFVSHQDTPLFSADAGLDQGISYQQELLNQQLNPDAGPTYQPDASPVKDLFGGWPTADQWNALKAQMRMMLEAKFQLAHASISRWDASATSRLPQTLQTGAGDDRVDINMGSDGRVHVNLNGTEAWSGSQSEFHALTIDTGDGNDVVTNNVDGAMIVTGAGNDAVNNNASQALIDTGLGNDRVVSKGWSNEILTGEGNDSVVATGETNRIDTGMGDDSVDLIGSGNNIRTGDGNDKVTTHDYETTTPSTPWSFVHNGENTIDTGEGDDEVFNNETGRGDVLRTGGGSDVVRNENSESYIDAGNGNNSVWNSGDRTTIKTGDGYDDVRNEGEYARIFTGEANDYVKNTGGQGTYIETGAGADIVYVSENHDEVIPDSSKVVHFPYGDNTVYEKGKTIPADAVEVNTGDGQDNVINADNSNLIVDGQVK